MGTPISGQFDLTATIVQRSGAIFAIAALVLVYAFVLSGPLTSEDKSAPQAQADAEPQDPSPQDEAASAQKLQDLKKAADEQAAEDADNSKKWNVPIEQVAAAREKLDDAYEACLTSLESNAKYEYKSDFFPNYGWRTDGRSIFIEGRDVHLQNAFGAYASGYLRSYGANATSVTPGPLLNGRGND